MLTDKELYKDIDLGRLFFIQTIQAIIVIENNNKINKIINILLEATHCSLFLHSSEVDDVAELINQI